MFGTSWVQRYSCSCPSQPSRASCDPLDHSIQTYLWGCTGNQFIVFLFFKNCSFISLSSCGLFFFFCKLDHCASNFGGTVDWVAHLRHGDGPGTMPQEDSNLITLQPKTSCRATALKRLEAPGKQRKGTKPVFINLLQICLCWFLQVNVSPKLQ